MDKYGLLAVLLYCAGYTCSALSTKTCTNGVISSDITGPDDNYLEMFRQTLEDITDNRIVSIDAHFDLQKQEKSDTASMKNNSLTTPQNTPATTENVDAACNYTSFIFSGNSSNNYVAFTGTLPAFEKFTFCFWVRPVGEQEWAEGTILSYVASNQSDSITITLRHKMLQIRVNNKTYSCKISGRYNRSHLCVKMVNGVLACYENGTQIILASAAPSMTHFIEGGMLHLGQIKSCNESEAMKSDFFCGIVDGLFLWNSLLNDTRIRTMAHSNNCQYESDHIVTFNSSNSIVGENVIANWNQGYRGN